MHGFHKLNDVKNIDVPERCISEIIQPSPNDHATKPARGFVKNRCTTNAVQAAEVMAGIGCEGLPDKRVRRCFTHIMELQIAISASPLATASTEPGASLAKKRVRHFVSPCGRIRIITCLSCHSFAATSSEAVSSMSRERMMTGRLIGLGMVSMTGVSSTGAGR